jgi:tetrahydromethanopterin S-methyltransferase subunit C
MTAGDGAAPPWGPGPGPAGGAEVSGAMPAGDADGPGHADGPGAGRPLPGWLWMTAGMLGLVLGVLWTAQGLDLVHDSIMSDVTAFAVAGPVLAVAGLALIVMGVRIRARSKEQAAAQDGSAAPQI